MLVPLQSLITYIKTKPATRDCFIVEFTTCKRNLVLCNVHDNDLRLWSHESSPWRIVDDCGGAFTMGAIGGGIFQAVKGFRNAPSVSSVLVIVHYWAQA